jgi:ribosome biogenesis GTPase
MKEGLVLIGINNIYTVDCDNVQYRCRIKGKVLQDDVDYYNPIAVGDYVSIMEDPITPDTGWITDRRPRKNSLVRFNNKKRAPQVIAANVDLIVCVTTAKSPPFRPRFLDRLIIAALSERIEFLVCVNKTDLGIDDETRRRLDQYRTIGYEVIEMSAETSDGFEKLERQILGKKVVFAGQSGVGKTTILNRIEPTLRMRVGEISRKYDRGIHTTRFAVMVRTIHDTHIIDTPGIREMTLFSVEPEQLRYYFEDFKVPARSCAYSSCLHLSEPNCGVRDAVERGIIHADRYESYSRLYESLKERKDDW